MLFEKLISQILIFDSLMLIMASGSGEQDLIGYAAACHSPSTVASRSSFIMAFCPKGPSLADGQKRQPASADCQSALNFDPLSASNIDPLVRRSALAGPALVRVAEGRQVRMGLRFGFRFHEA